MLNGFGQYIAAALIAVLIMGTLFGCASYQPSCFDNPRNMRCMTADQLRKELAERGGNDEIKNIE